MFYRLKNQIVGEIKQTEVIKGPIINSRMVSPVDESAVQSEIGGRWRK